MYLYVRNGNIIFRSPKKRELLWFLKWCSVYEYLWNSGDRLIFENGKILKYESSQQYKEDTNQYHLTRELEQTKKKNQELFQIANNKIKKDWKSVTNEPSEYQRKLYLLKNMKW